jgi:hypothetical protein
VNEVKMRRYEMTMIEVEKAEQGQYQRYPSKSSPGDYRLGGKEIRKR